MIKNDEENKKTLNFEEFESGLTTDYQPPQYVAQPADDDKGFFMFKKAFNSQRSYFKPGIRSTNQDLDDHTKD